MIPVTYVLTPSPYSMTPKKVYGTPQIGFSNRSMRWNLLSGSCRNVVRPTRIQNSAL